MGATSLPPDSNRDIRTDFSTDCAAGTSPVVFPDDEEISLPIDLLSYPNQFLRARNRAEPATFATLSINFDLRHHPTNWNTGIMEKWNNGFEENQLIFFLTVLLSIVPIFQHSIVPCPSDCLHFLEMLDLFFRITYCPEHFGRMFSIFRRGSLDLEGILR
jgi:hypothetical protein